MAVYSAQRLHRLRVVVTGGGTGGHTYPALTTIRTLRARLSEAGTEPDLLWVGVEHGLEARIAAEEGIPFRAITTGKLRRSPNLRELGRNVADAFRIPLGLLQAVSIVVRNRPAVVFSSGGYVSVPIGIAAWLTRRPLVMHEQILTLGLANRILAMVATRILLSHPSSVEHLPARARKRAVVTGNPIRPEVLAGDPARGFAAHGLDPELPLVFVTGGAQGAVQVNDLVAQILPDLLNECQVLHQCGGYSLDRMRQVAAALPPHLAHRYRVVDYVHGELPDVLAAASIVVARSGAGTVAELTALGKACVFIPLIPTGGDEQRRTARHLAEAGAARVLAGPEATPENLRNEVLTLLREPQWREQLAEAARQHGRPDAAAAVTRELIDAAREG
ncbi:UDP-N-acetylglucosamine--N-acetylmuramyl-(pentapeptide) pyrophosphoryl-undecaprenol N-acetylglucosamine transferase [Micromonospora echinofusca]|uniref:UDP-N-acetylglucosamine--N-acetylmuramyl-(pentapeptide) pyrophosphoryl-undecaprenol N-acetylglucosamine transferase n=1 Tax=Micromonospora echinofusca TaxID=47858 RepID=A0ABS3VU26_MICEH|nr:UDP-N-acetylglucosamine--N-acetylmuramyl-(pentapeptide) pyrophosphoryl-undecaprenol N-acetylglucosamine transferase [Micromonospora echinofusca]MBO4208040.1 UDP-N-acetylglucosamine--N-acetylmuramyl-(pentapeptide) pyrophosphoryl-undecaprenol N-acetylglucosamine transferase [Micromonospora echinofusca]